MLLFTGPKCPTLVDDIHGNAQAQKDSRIGELEWQKNYAKVAAILSLQEVFKEHEFKTMELRENPSSQLLMTIWL